MTTDPALNVPCPTCHVGRGKPCRSYRDIAVHQGRREALAGRRKTVQPKPVLRGPDGLPVPVFIDETGLENVIPESAEWWPPWEPPPVAGCLAESGITVTGWLWCPVHNEHEELRDGIPAVRMGGWP